MTGIDYIQGKLFVKVSYIQRKLKKNMKELCGDTSILSICPTNNTNSPKRVHYKNYDWL